MEISQEYQVFMCGVGMKAFHSYFPSTNGLAAFIHSFIHPSIHPPIQRKVGNIIWQTLGGCDRKWLIQQSLQNTLLSHGHENTPVKKKSPPKRNPPSQYI
jgi:hypothetical protein